MEALHFGPTAGAATPAAVAAAMPQSGGAAQRRGDIASLVYVAEVEGAACAHDRHRACRGPHFQLLRGSPAVSISTQTKHLEHPVEPRILRPCGTDGWTSQ